MLSNCSRRRHQDSLRQNKHHSRKQHRQRKTIRQRSLTRSARSSRFPLFMQVGDYRLEVIPDTEFRLDGGAMFGVVPRVLWEKVCPPDELNRIRLNMNCVFIETPNETILIETGI